MSNSVTQVIVDVPGPITVVQLLEQGPAGPQGPVGPSGGASFPVVLSAVVSGGQAVALSGGLGQPAIADTVQDASLFVGISLQGGIAGGTIAVCGNGLVSETGWDWTPGEAIFLDGTGALTQTMPGTGVIFQVAEAVANNTIFVRPDVPIQIV
jgi:hypothetical protein